MPIEAKNMILNIKCVKRILYVFVDGKFSTANSQLNVGTSGLTKKTGQILASIKIN